MKRLRAWIRNSFGFSRIESNAFIILLPLLTIILFSEPLFRYVYSINSRPTFNPKQLDSLIATWKWEKAKQIDIPPAPSLVDFNPNNASEKELSQLGISEKLVRRILNYRSKGGIFRVRHDLSKIYGFDSILYKALIPYIQLPDALPVKKESFQPHPSPPAPVAVDLNLADSVQLLALRGVGPKRSSTLIKYRTRLGGFISMDQLSEVWGLDSTVLSEIKSKTFISESFVPRKMNINRLNEKQLCELPYVSFRLAKAIAAYRFQHGDFASVEDLKRIAVLDTPTFKKIKPYLTIKD